MTRQRIHGSAINHTAHGEKLFEELGYKKEKIHPLVVKFSKGDDSISFYSAAKHVHIDGESFKAYGIDISTLKAINAMVYELGWYKNEQK